METALTSPFVLLKKAWSLVLQRPNISSFLLLGVIPQVISLTISTVLAYTNNRIDLQSMIVDLNKNIGDASAFVYVMGLLIGGLGTIITISLISTWYTAFLYKVYQATALGNLSSLTSYARPAKSVTVRLLVTYMTVGLFASLGFLLLIIPGIIIAVRFMFAPIISAVEDKTIKPIDESKRLVKGRLWKLLGRSLVMIVCYNIPLSVLQAIHPLFGTVWAVTSPIFGFYFFLVYLDFKRTAIVTT